MKKIKDCMLIGSLLLTFYFIHPYSANAELLERIVAIVNDDVILQSEFFKAFEAASEYNPDVMEADVLDEMINRLLLLKEARKLRLTSSDDDQGIAKGDNIIFK